MIFFFLAVGIPLLLQTPVAPSINLGGEHTFKSDRYTITVKLSPAPPEDFWNYYTVALEVQNNTSDLITVDWSKTFLVDDSGLALFEGSSVDELLKSADRLISALKDLSSDNRAFLDRLRGINTTSEVRTLRQTIESQQNPSPKEKPLEIPPGARQTISKGFHTPLKPKWITLSLLGIRIGNESPRVEPIRVEIR